jgi:glycosyltransferase involved in cell wall biosynthesis
VTSSPVITVVIPTRDRSQSLRETLQSFAAQTMPSDQFEIVVVDDGSTDGTADTCAEFETSLPVKYCRLDRAGISAAKNLGLFVSRGTLTLFFDDDDLADRNLLLEHVRAHERHPEEFLAVLGYTQWAPGLHVTEVMQFLTDVGQVLFSYASMREGELLGCGKFYGGRTSCKRAFLVQCGVFDQSMPGFEDIELGFRLAQHGLKILYHPKAISHMNRAVTYADFCRRCEAQGACRVVFGRLHPDPFVHQALGLDMAEERWKRARETLPGQVARVGELEQIAEGCHDNEELALARDELFPLYRSTFESFFSKGTVEGIRSSSTLEIRGACAV